MALVKGSGTVRAGACTSEMLFVAPPPPTTRRPYPPPLCLSFFLPSVRPSNLIEHDKHTLFQELFQALRII